MSTGLDALPGLLDCMHCGLCLQACPTYTETSSETDSPRGRLFLMRAVAEDRLAVADAMPALERCVQCRACEPACPSKVPYSEILHEHMEIHAKASGQMSNWLGSSVRMKLAGKVLRFGRQSGLLKLAASLPNKRLRRAANMVPHKPKLYRPKPGAEFEAAGDQRGVVALHLGCVEAELFGHNIQDSIATLTAEGFKVVCPPQLGCCGAAAAHDGDSQAGRESGQQSLAQLQGFDAIIVPAAGCAAFLGSLDSNAGVVDPMIFLARAGLRGSLKAVKRAVVYATPCHRQNVIGDAEEMRTAMLAIPGLELLESEESEMCCGAGGSAFLREPELTDAIGQRKAKFLQQTGATQVVSGNPGCAMQLEAKLRERDAKMQIVHPISLLRESLGV
ncbi:MAG: (Fe-S)-binding protein [Planctomycetes bacterium]|nr:(Fe-S)-binding protein [Planctomycetota bacterium]MCP4771762.1 (Fe-S)-binding protein [Planctomycetota bacterium]MCP4860995.1 (Fe-S)-binding protein [Planctomycetota bacterium]